ncbi:peptidase M28 [Hymenobacter coccineus]|uniref:Peptidase M28 n=1 Tax=Hymenobacter coccineus TaxID=1908235 RepID=A0A1G1TLT8_9BACT|nr:peptidase M28 [Hymenobacter coccineus]
MAQQGPHGKVKTKSKPGRTAAAPAAAAAPAPPTDWSVPYAASITPDGLRKDLIVLASDEYEGRETGTKGQRMAADYISKRFAALGLAGPVQGSDNPYIQHFSLESRSWGDGISLKVGKRAFQWSKDFYSISNDSPFPTETELQIVFAGYGLDLPNYSDYTGLDVTGKDVVVLTGEPLDAQGKSLLSTNGKSVKLTGPGNMVTAATKHGARSILILNTDADDFATTLERVASYSKQPRLAAAGQTGPKRTAAFVLGPAASYALLHTNEATLKKYEAATTAAGKPVKASFKPAKTTLAAPRKVEPLSTENVLGYLEGSDKKDELVVMSAHYDHLGLKDGKVFNGADDDGSGTVSVLSFADAFVQAKKDGHGPRRSILFLANTGEEEGLLGSQYYTDHPVFPLESTVADVNIDMVGRVDPEHEGKGDYVYIVGADKLSSELNAVSEATNQKYNPIALDYKYNDPNDPEHIYYRSDHYNFAKHKIPVAFYTSGLHADYHKETDEVDKINFPAMARRDQLIFHTAWELANRDNRPVVDSNKP